MIPLDPDRSTRSPPTNLEQQTTPSLYDAVELASKQRPKLRRRLHRRRRAATTCSTKETPAARRRPGGDNARTCSSRPRPQALPEDHAGDPRRSSRARSSSEDRSPTSASETRTRPSTLLRAPDQPALSGKDITNPEQNFDPRRTSRTSPSTSPTRASRPSRRSPRTSPARPGELPHGRPVRRSRSSSTARSSRGRSSTTARTRRDRRPHRRADLRQLHAPGGAGPRRLPEDRRAADRPQADQPEHGLGDARPAGARPGPEGGRSSAWSSCCSS